MADKDCNDMFCLAITTVKLGEVGSLLKHSCCLLKSQWDSFVKCHALFGAGFKLLLMFVLCGNMGQQWSAIQIDRRTW